MLQRLIISSAIVATVIVTRAEPAIAQSNVEVNAGIQFDFVNPGARSLGLGSAFTAIADDATTAFTNPAGLREISRKEISFEGRVRRYKTPFTSSGHGFGNASGRGIDTVNGLVDGTSKESVAGVSFLSFVYPTAKWALAGYFHELAHFKSAIQTEGAFVGPDPIRLNPVRGSVDLTVRDYGLSGSYRLSDEVSIGAGIAIYDFWTESRTTRFGLVGTTAPPSYDTVANTQTQDGDEFGVGVNVGVLLKPDEKVQIGAVYRKGASFDVRVKRVDGDVTNPPFIDDVAIFRVPDVFSLGLMIRPVEAFRIGVDYTRVQYSQMTEGFVDLFPAFGTAVSDYTIDDGNEVHVGAEYFFANAKVPVALRGGVWYDPAHSLRYSGPIPQFQTLFRDRDDQMHYAVGGGVVIKRLEVNAGVDLSDLVNSFSLSTVVRF